MASGDVLALIGAGAGFYFGGPAGAQLGYQAGSAAGGRRSSGGGGRAPAGEFDAVRSLFGGRTSRYATLNPTRVSGNAFAQGCIRYGVGSPQCPTTELDRWTALAQRKFPNAYQSVFAPLQARRSVSLSYVRGLASQYLSKRSSAPGAQQAAQLLLGSGSASSASRGLRL